MRGYQRAGDCSGEFSATRKFKIDFSGTLLRVLETVSWKETGYRAKTRNSFTRYALGATTQGDSSIKVAGGPIPILLPRAVQEIKLLPRSVTWSNFSDPGVEVSPTLPGPRRHMGSHFQQPKVNK